MLLTAGWFRVGGAGGGDGGRAGLVTVLVHVLAEHPFGRRNGFESSRAGGQGFRLADHRGRRSSPITRLSNVAGQYN